jgi:hypothetical protein
LDGKNLGGMDQNLNGTDFFVSHLIKRDGVEVNYNHAHACMQQFEKCNQLLKYQWQL